MRILISLLLATLLYGCAADQKAPVVHKEQLYFSRDGVTKLIAVKQGDSLPSIARAYNTSASIIASINHLKKGAKLQVGQVIKVPVDLGQVYEEKSDERNKQQDIEEFALMPENKDSLTSTARQTAASNQLIMSDDYNNSVSNNIDTEQQMLTQPIQINTEASPNYSIASEKDVLSKTKGGQDLYEDIDVQNIDKAKVISQAKSDKNNNNFKFSTPLNSPNFIWPLQGKVLAKYGKFGNNFNEGINIAAPSGTPVMAIAAGEVVYAGSEPRVYGNLVIIKHNNSYLSAYAHNDKILVKKYALVKQGQIISTVGKTGAVQSPQLHFSMRKNKKTIDPESISE